MRSKMGGESDLFEEEDNSDSEWDDLGLDE
jgi:hypothetical protein